MRFTRIESVWNVRLVLAVLLGFTSLAFANSNPDSDNENLGTTGKISPPARVQGAPMISKDFVEAIRKTEDRSCRLVVTGDRDLTNKAFGPLQIRQPCVTDVNRVYGTNFRAEDCQGNLELSIWMLESYMSIYATPKRLGHKPTYEDMARIWNGGPNGYKKPSTRDYWIKVRGFWPKPTPTRVAMSVK